MLTFGTIAAAVIMAAAVFTLGWMLLDAYATRRRERAEIAIGVGATQEWGETLRAEVELADTDTVDMYALRIRLDLDDIEETLSARLSYVTDRAIETLNRPTTPRPRRA